jgi:hypothetical protein
MPTQGRSFLEKGTTFFFCGEYTTSGLGDFRNEAYNDVP